MDFITIAKSVDLDLLAHPGTTQFVSRFITLFLTEQATDLDQTAQMYLQIHGVMDHLILNPPNE